MSVTLQQDPDNDQIYIALVDEALKKGAVHHTRRIDENIAFDYDARGKAHWDRCDERLRANLAQDNP